MRQKKRDKKSDISTEFLQSLVDQDSAYTSQMLQQTTDKELRGLIKSMMAVAQMLLGYAVKMRGLDISEEAQIVVEIPGNGEENPS